MRRPRASLLLVAYACVTVHAAALPTTACGLSNSMANSMMSSSSEASRVAAELRLTPEAIAASGASATAASDILSRIESASAQRAAATAAKAQLDTAIQAVAAAGRLSDEEPQNPEYIAGLSAARSAADTARSALLTANVSLRQVALAGLSSDQRGRLERFLARTTRAVPDALRVLVMSDSDFDGLEAACAVEERCLQVGAPVPASVTATLSSARANPDVAIATQGLSANLASIQQAWAAWVP